MSRYLAARAVQTAITLALMSLVVFVLIGLMPGDPIDMMISGDPQMTSEDAARLRAMYGLHKQLLERAQAWTLSNAPSFTIRGGAREVIRGIVARGLGLR